MESKFARGEETSDKPPTTAFTSLMMMIVFARVIKHMRIFIVLMLATTAAVCNLPDAVANESMLPMIS